MTRTIARILVPTDFSAPSNAALDYARTLAERFGASLHLLHVVEDPFINGALGTEIYIGASDAVRDSLIEEAAARLEAVVAEWTREGLRVTSEILMGHPAKAIRDVAEQRQDDLIVMGTHGRSGMAHLLLGSVAEKVLRHAPCPVLTVKHEAVGAPAVERTPVTASPVPAQ
jgi:universal stress protein A